MRSIRFHRTVGGLVCVVMVLAGSAVSSFSQDTPSPPAASSVPLVSPDAIPSAAVEAPNGTEPPKAVAGACFVPPAKLQDEKIKNFLADPKALMTRHPEGGIALATEVRSLAGSSSDTVSVLVELARTAGPAQQAGIGAGLARAALTCSRTDPDYAAMIQEAVAASALGPMITAFASVSDEVQTAALASGPSGGGGGATVTTAGGIAGDGAAVGGTAGLDGTVTFPQSGELNGLTRSGTRLFDNGTAAAAAVSATTTGP